MLTEAQFTEGTAVDRMSYTDQMSYTHRKVRLIIIKNYVE